MEIPKKFQNEDGTLNSDAVLKSYSELEKKMGNMVSIPTDDSDPEQKEKFLRAIGVPEDISEYPCNPLFDEEDLRQKFKDAGLNKKQVEAIYEIASEYLQPTISNLFAKNHEQESMAELKSFFGSTEKMRDALIQIETFGEKFLPRETFESLSSNAAGIRSIYSMMQSMEPSISTGRNTTESLSESDLKKMMQDPKYWRDHDAEFIRKIETGFKKLYS